MKTAKVNSEKLSVFITILIITFSGLSYSQVGIGTTVPNSASALDISDSTKGILIPRLSTANRLSLALTETAPGLMVFDTNTMSFWYNSSTTTTPVWNEISILTSANFWSKSGNSGTSPAVDFVGTTDNQSLVLKTNDSVRLFISGQNGKIGINTDSPVGNLHLKSNDSNEVILCIDGPVGSHRDIQFMDNGTPVWEMEVEGHDCGRTENFIIYSVAADREIFTLNENGRVMINRPVGVDISEDVVSIYPQAFNAVFYNPSGGGTFNDYTYEAATSSGTDFTLLSSTSDYLYIGKKVPYNSILVKLNDAASSATITAQYWNGSSWVAITSDLGFNDGTSGLSQNGAMSWLHDTISDWVQNSINGTTLFWVRLKASSLSGSPTAMMISSESGKSLSIFQAQNDDKPSFFVDNFGHTSIGGGEILGNNLLQINSKFNSTPQAVSSHSVVEIDVEDPSQHEFIYRMSVNNSSSYPGFYLYRSRGTLSSPAILSNGDNMGGMNFVGYAGNGWKDAGSIKGVVDGTPGNNDMPFALSFSTSLDGTASPVERFRITNSGKLGVSTSSPTALLDLNGSTGYNQLRMRQSYTPTSSADTNGSVGDMAWDDNFIYIKTSAGWKKAALSSW